MASVVSARHREHIRRGNAKRLDSHCTAPSERKAPVDARRLKAHDLADRARITVNDGCYTVPSQSGNGSYTVILDESGALCDCPDFELRGQPGKPCKHIMACRLYRDRQARGAEQDTENIRPSAKVPRKTYGQKWDLYNAAQCNEGLHFGELLADLCQTIEEPARTGRGRKPVPLADQVYAAVLKVYSLFSARRFMDDLRPAIERGHISREMCFNSVLKALENPDLSPILERLIQVSSLPMRVVETTFAPDSSGFCTSKFIRWYDVKYGVTRDKAVWVKAHLMTGVKTNIVTAVFIGDKDDADSPQFPKLLEDTAKGFVVKEVDADKAYTTAEHFEALDRLNGTLYAPFKSNATGAAGGIFQKMYHKFMAEREDFLKHYHQRSNVESTFSAIKRKFGDNIRSKTDVAMKNEALCKILAHNICVCIMEWYTLGIEPFFGNEEPEEESPRVLRFPGQTAACT
jgi:transposase